MLDTITLFETITAREASHSLGQYLTLTEQGKSFSILRHGKPVAKLIPVNVPAPLSEKDALARKKKIEKALSFRANRPYGGKFNRMDAYEEDEA